MSKIGCAGSHMAGVKAQAKERREFVADLRRRNLTYQQIADVMGISRQRVHTILNGRADERKKHG